MTAQAHPTAPALDAPEIARRFALAIAGLIGVMGAVFNPHPNPPVPGILLWGYFLRTSNRFSRLIARLAAGIAPRKASIMNPENIGFRYKRYYGFLHFF